MRKSSRLAMLGLSVLASSGLVAGTASAQSATAHADKFAARATADAMVIDLFGTRITGSSALADLDASPKGLATVREILLGPVSDSGDLTAEVSGVGTFEDVAKPEGACLLDELEAIPGIRRVDITCPEARANMAGNLPSARALGAEVVLEPSVSMVLETLGLQDTVTGTVDTVFADVLNPLVTTLTGGTPVEDLASDTVQTVEDVLGDALTLNSTARVVVAPALAEVTSDAEKIVSSAHAQGVRIELLPVDELGATNGLLPDDLLPGEPLITITVGDAKATCTYSRTTATKSCPAGEAAAVKIELGTNALTEALGVNGTLLTVDQGVEQCILVDTPLESCVAVATAGVDADGNPYANATTVSLFKGINGGINLITGAVTAGSAGAPAQALPATVPDLPRTGAESNIAIMGAGLLGLAVLVRRIAAGRA